MYFTTMLEALCEHAEKQGEQLAYTFLNSDTERESVTYQQLNERVRSVAGKLLRHAAPGELAILMYPAGLDFIDAFLGCLLAGIIPVPAYPPRNNRNAERILAIARDCAPKLLLSTTELLPGLQDKFADSLSLGGAELLATDSVDQGPITELPNISPQQVAFLQYTSGSTGHPKGVVITHANLVANEWCIQRATRHTSQSIMCGWLPTFHDMGLLNLVLQPLFVGFHSVFMSPTRFLVKPIRWLQAISEFRATTSGGPNFAYEHCLNLISREQLEGIDLSSWSVAFNGSEPVRERTLARFSEFFAACGFSARAFSPCYGMAESTLFISGGPAHTHPRVAYACAENLKRHKLVFPSADDTRAVAPIVSCGIPAEESRLKIVDPESLEECPREVIGEIWVSGPSVAKGYWNADSECFRVQLAGAPDQVAYFRTGDLGFLKDGELYLTGRSKDLIIIRGRNIYPHDVESVIEQRFEFVEANSVAALGIDGSEGEALAVVVQATRWMVHLSKWLTNPELTPEVIERKASFDEIVRQLHEVVANAFDVRIDQLAFLSPGDFPRTSSGKVQRHRCKEGLLTGDLPFLALPKCVAGIRITGGDSTEPNQTSRENQGNDQ